MPRKRFALLNGLSQTLNRKPTCGTSLAVRKAPATNSRKPRMAHDLRPVAM